MYLFNIDKNFRFINVFDRTNVINWGIQRTIFNKRVSVHNEMLKNDVIYNLSFRFRDINFNNINDINFAINIIIVIATTFFEILIIIAFIFKLVIIIIIIIIFEKFVFKLIAFDLNIKDCFIINVSFNKF